MEIEKIYLKKCRDIFLIRNLLRKLLLSIRHGFQKMRDTQREMTVDNNPVSFTDASNIILCQRLEITNILSFNGHFQAYYTNSIEFGNRKKLVALS